jgi:hypothetical protein
MLAGLSSLKPQLDARGVRLIGVAGEHLGREEFLKDFWKGELYFDIGKKTWFPAIHGGKKSTRLLSNIFSAICGGLVAKGYKRIMAMNGGQGINYNLAGEGTVLGGLWVVHPTQGVIYERREKDWGDNATVHDMKNLIEAINKLPGTARGADMQITSPHAPVVPPPSLEVGVVSGGVCARDSPTGC